LWLILPLACLGSLLLLAGVAWLLLPKFALGYLESQAKTRGVELSGCALAIEALGWENSRLKLEHCQLRTRQAGAELQGPIDEIALTLAHFKPTQVVVRGAHFQLVGSPKFDQLFEKRRSALEASDLALELHDSDLTWGEAPSAVKLSELGYSSKSGDFQAKVQLGELLAGSLQRKADVVSVELALVTETRTRLQVRLVQDKDLGRLRVEFQQLEMAELARLGLLSPAPAENWLLDGQLTAEIPIGLNPAPAKGELALTVHGVNFPVPRELQGLVYGTPAQLDTRFNLDRSFTRAELVKTRFRIGALDMKGHGQLDLRGLALAFSLQLSGALTCDAIVRSAVSAHTDSELGKLAGRIAKLALKGAVDLSAAVRGNTQALDQLQVEKRVGVGCGIKPLPELPLDELRKLPDEVLKRLPPLPSTLPKLPQPPELDLKLPKLPLPRAPNERNLDQRSPDEQPAP
jgi:hypothetical protein